MKTRIKTNLENLMKSLEKCKKKAFLVSDLIKILVLGVNGCIQNYIYKCRKTSSQFNFKRNEDKIKI